MTDSAARWGMAGCGGAGQGGEWRGAMSVPTLTSEQIRCLMRLAAGEECEPAGAAAGGRLGLGLG